MALSRKTTRWHVLSEDPNGYTEGKPVIKYIAGKKLCVVRTSKGIFAIEEKCPHNGFSLALGKCSEDGETIICPLHRYAYDLHTGRSTAGSGGAARVFPVEKKEDGKYYIGTEETEWGWF